ncbi:hypothetical protein TSUD_328120 [Trifolium subterraneum]|uniref:peroxidase n=1 Tax=Trifolium subterraneum TaxID=3900 RepID=A0A2Z6MKK8_TRISU|nr:hypothetical protein TSUD_328120 [Trifolium subterraneum]
MQLESDSNHICITYIFIINVQGCDVFLIDPTNKTVSEKKDGANASVRGFDLIDEVKEALEVVCPFTVSCADIISLTTRDDVALSGGPKYSVPTGRRDGLVSNIADVELPGPDISIPALSKFFTTKGITNEEMVALLGAHTVCGFFDDRLTDFDGKRDPTMDPTMGGMGN